MEKVTTKYLSRVFQYLNTFEKEERHPAFATQIEPFISAIEGLNLTEPKSFLDLGCATGLVLFAAQEKLPKGSKVVGVDLNEKYIEVAKYTVPRANVMVTDIFSDSTKELIRNADIVYSYTPFGLKAMEAMWVILDKEMQEGAYYMSNHPTPATIRNFEMVGREEGCDCCNKTDIRVYRKEG